MDPMKRLSAFLYGLDPTSALVCSVEGDPPGDGGGQAPQQPQPAPAPPASPPQFSPEQLAWIEAEKTRASNAAAAAARRAEQTRHGNRGEPQQQQPQQNNTQPQQPQANGPDPAQVYMRLRTFDRAVDRYGLTDSARSILEGDFNTANPPDPVAWVTQRAEAFGWRPAGAATPATPAPGTPAPQTHQGPPVTGSGAPANPSNVVTDDTPILRLSNEARELLRRRIGDAAYVDRMRKEFRTVRVRG